MTGQRNDLVEILRFAGAVGIVYFHVGAPAAWIGHSALLVFVIASVFFAATRRSSFERRLRVLYIWIFWSVVYGLLKIGQAVHEGRDISSEFDWWMLLAGPILPLWFLPFIFLINSLVSWYFDRLVERPSLVENVALVCALFACLLMSQVSVGAPFDQWVLGIGGTIVAVSIVRSGEAPYYIFSILALLAGMQLISEVSHTKMFLLASVLSAAVFLWLPSWTNDFARRLGSISLGVYVLHHGVTVALESPMSGLARHEAALVVVVVSSVAALVLKSIPRLEKVI